MIALLSTSNTSTMSPIATCSIVDITTSTKNSPVHVLDFASSDSPKKTATVVIPKYLLPSLTDDSLASALAKGVALTSNKDETATFSLTDDSSVALSSISSEEGCTTTSSSSKRRALFSPYWKKSGEQPLEMIPTGVPDHEVAAIRSAASSVTSCPYEREIRELQYQASKPRLVKSDTALMRPKPPSILRKGKYSGRRHTAAATKSDLEATSMAILGALATIAVEDESPRVKFDARVNVRVFTKERPMLEPAEPGWSKMFTN